MGLVVDPSFNYRGSLPGIGGAAIHLALSSLQRLQRSRRAKL